jgi:hypothetical protein
MQRSDISWSSCGVMQGRVRLTNRDRWFFIQLYRWFPSILKVLTIIRPETLVRWHRAGFRLYWRWKSGSGHLVRASVRVAAARHGHSRSANCVPITLAKRLR